MYHKKHGIKWYFKRGKTIIWCNNWDFTKAGYQIIFPKDLSNLCCGMPFSSKGFIEASNTKSSQLEDALLYASEFGNIQFYVIQVLVQKMMEKFFT